MKGKLIKYPTKKPERLTLTSVLFTAVYERPQPKRKLERYLRKLLLTAYSGEPLQDGGSR